MDGLTKALYRAGVETCTICGNTQNGEHVNMLGSQFTIYNLPFMIESVLGSQFTQSVCWRRIMRAARLLGLGSRMKCFEREKVKVAFGRNIYQKTLEFGSEFCQI